MVIKYFLFLIGSGGKTDVWSLPRTEENSGKDVIDYKNASKKTSSFTVHIQYTVGN